MNTSLIFAELIIIGLEGSVWLALLFAGTFGVDAFAGILNLFKDWQLFIAAVLLALVYVVGVIIDRVADALFRKKEGKLDDEIVGDMPVSIPVMRFSLGTQNDFLNQQLEYTRTRMRIVRASTVNFLLIAASFVFFLLRQMTDLSAAQHWQYMIVAALAGAAFSYSSYRTWKSLIRAHLRLAKEMYDHQTKQEKKKSTVKKR